MSKYTLFQIPPLSFYSTDLYRDMALNKEGIGFGYLFLLLAVCWLVLVFSIGNKVSSYFDDYSPGFLAQFPEITIFDGQASIRESQPYYMDDPETGMPFAVIDTTGSIKSLDETEAVMLLTRNDLIVEKSEMETRSFNLSEMEDMVIDRELLTTWIEATKSYLPVVMYPFALAGSYFYRIVQVLVYALIGLLFASICKTELEYSQLLRLSVVAVTPSIIINTLFWVTGINLPMAGLMFFVLTMVYLFLGIKATAEADPDQEAVE
jgi:hypothetical protein